MFEQQFRKNFPLEKRKNTVDRIYEKYPGKIPVLVFRAQSAVGTPMISKNKFLVSDEMSMGRFIAEIKRTFIMENDHHPVEQQAIFIFTGSSALVALHATMGEIYKKYKDPEDGFLYITYAGENAFGFFF